MRETIVTIMQAPSDVEYYCPYCGSTIMQEFEDFLDEQGLLWSDFPDWCYENIICSQCGREIDNISYDFD